MSDPTITKDEALAGMDRIASDPKLNILTCIDATIGFLYDHGWVMTYEGLKPISELATP